MTHPRRIDLEQIHSNYNPEMGLYYFHLAVSESLNSIVGAAELSGRDWDALGAVIDDHISILHALALDILEADLEVVE